VNRTVLIYIDVMERYHFFVRFVDALRELNYRVIFVTNKFSIYLLLKRKFYKTILLKEYPLDREEDHTDELKKSLSVLNRYHDLQTANKIYNHVLKNLENLLYKMTLEYFFIWNGSTTIAKALDHFAIENKIQRRFFEISNLGAKIFVDPQGVNAQSLLAKNADVLDRIKIDDTTFDQWYQVYYQSKGVPKQAANATRIPFSFLVDWFGFTFFNMIREDRRNPLLVLYKKYKLKQGTVTEEKSIDKTYIFLPLQVSDDSQLKINSDIDNFGAIEKVYEYCKKKNIQLVIKLHPAETNFQFKESIMEFIGGKNIVLTQKNIEELIHKACEIFVINSTVGVEAMLQKKKVHILGRSYYQDFTYERLKSYICAYLVDIDYFMRNDKVDKVMMEKILYVDKWYHG